MKNYNKKYRYGSIIELKGKRLKGFAARITIGYNEKGYPIYHFLGTFEEELDTHLCLRDYNNKPFDIYVSEEKYKKIVKFAKLPSSVLIKATDEIDRSGYTFKEVYEEWKAIYFPTAQEIEIEKKTHKKTKGKLSKSNVGNLAAAFNNSKELHNRVYSSLKKLDFQKIINNTSGCRSKIYNLQNLYKKLDEYALEMDIITKDYARYIKIDIEEDLTNRHPYSYSEIKFLWSLEGNQDVDILLILLYSCMRINELLELKIDNIFLQESYAIGGLKTENGRNRIIPFHHKILHIVKRYYNKNNEYLFTENGDKIEYDNYYQRFIKLKEEWSEKDFDKTHVIHETRHTGESELDRRGANKRCRDLIMGHASKDVGDRIYNHKTIQELKNTIELISYEEVKIVELAQPKTTFLDEKIK